MKPTIGVLITYFNEQGLLQECLDSLLIQSQRPNEILIYDDASAVPAGGSILPDPTVRIIRGEINQGPARGRNILLRASQSEYIHFHDADDLFQSDWCQRVREAIEQTQTDVVLAEISSYRDKEMKSRCVMGLNRLAAGEDFVRFALRNSILTSASTCRRQWAVAIGGFRESLKQSEDFDYHVRLAASGARFYVIEEPLVLKRIRDTSYSSSNRKRVWSSVTDSVRALSKELPSRYQHDLAEAAARAGSHLFRLGAYQQAREAFRLASRLGLPSFDTEPPPYRFLAKIFGPEVAEWSGMFYRKVVPTGFRRVVRDWKATRTSPRRR